MFTVVRPAPSAAAEVMILKVEPGGCRALKAMPAAASMSPLRGFHYGDAAVMPVPVPRRASSSSFGLIVVRIVAPLAGGCPGDHALTFQQRAAKPPRELVLEHGLKAILADSRPPSG